VNALCSCKLRRRRRVRLWGESVIRMSHAMAEEISVRFAESGDMDFVAREGHVAADVLRRKVEWREVIVAEQCGELVGQLRLEYLWSVVPYVALVIVVENQRRCGVGKAMLRFAEEFLRGRGHDALYSSSQADEPEAQGWHRRAGFEECGFIAGVNGGVGEVFFRKRLGVGGYDANSSMSSEVEG
jgi:GNAT superfamily N-acetyltransferase